MAQIGTEVGAPGLGRDLAAMPEAFLGGGPGGAPRVRAAEPPPVASPHVPIANRLTAGVEAAADTARIARENDVLGPNRGAYLENR